MNLHKETANIRETSRGWLWCEMGEYHPTAAESQRAVLRRNSEIANNTGASGVILTWHTASRIGTMVVEAITSTKETQ